MTEEEQKWYEAQNEMFLSPGWKEFMEQVQKMYDFYRDARQIPDGKLDFFKGRLDVLGWLLSWQDSVTETLQRLQGEPDQ